MQPTFGVVPAVRPFRALPDAFQRQLYAVPALEFLGAWLFVLIVFALRVQAIYSLAEHPMPWTEAFAVSAVDWLPWLAFAPFVAWVVAHVRFSRERLPSALLLHAANVLGITVVHAIVRPALAHLLGLTGPSSFAVLFLMLVQGDLLLYAVTAGAMMAVRYARALQGRERSAARTELRAAQLEQTLAESRLALLRTQLDPHFLFNTMHGVSSLMHEDPDAADTMLTRLGDLLRASMNESAPHEVTLEEELDFSECYLGIQRARFGSRLRTTVRIHPGALQARVPSMLLQPLLENAIRHGIAPRREGGCLDVEARVEGRTLRVFVRDDGVGPSAGATGAARAPGADGAGIGLRNTRLRIKQMYGAAATLELRPRVPEGTEVAVSFPLSIERDGVIEGRGGLSWAARVR